MNMTRRISQQRRGAIAVLSCFIFVLVMAVIALAVDSGYLMVAKADLQRAADSAALAGAMRYADQESMSTVIRNVRDTAAEYARRNTVLGGEVDVEKNYFNSDPNGDVVIGTYDFSNPGQGMYDSGIQESNAVRVRIRRDARTNGQVPLFFARIWGSRGADVDAEATAAMIRSVRGFRVPSSGEAVPFLPIVINEEHWDDMISHGTEDSYSWDDLDGTISTGPDGVPEVVLYPNDNGSGNYGTVDVGGTDNSTANISDQIQSGIDEADLAPHGGSLELDSSGELAMTGDTGISAGLKDDLTAIAGVPRIIPLYREVDGQGNTATYTVVRFVGGRIMAVNLTGNSKGIMIQPANVVVRGLIEGDTGGDATSERVYSPPVLVR